jgi:hypothetical protein
VAENRRSSTRHEVELPIDVVTQGANKQLKMQNLSLGGALIEMRRLPMGERVQVKFTLPTSEEPIETAATVRWATESAVGVQFDGLRAKDVWALNKFFEQLSG